MKHLKTTVFITLAIFLIFFTACGGKGGGNKNNQPKPSVTIQITGTLNARVGETGTLYVTISNTTNTDFTVNAPAAAGCERSGNTVRCTPTAAGTYTVTVTASADTTKSASATVTATAPVAVTISITPETADVPVGVSATFTVIAQNTDFTVNAPAAAGCERSGNTVRCTPTAAGTYTVTVTANADTTKSASATVTATAPVAVTISITPETADVPVGVSATFTVIAQNTDFTVNAPAAAGCERSGNTVRCTPTAAGTYTVTVTASADTTKSASATVTATASVPVVHTVTAVSGGYSHTIVLKDDWSLWAYGDNYYGQLGDGSEDEYRVTPVRIGTGTNWKSVSAGAYFTIALKTDGSLWAWGRNDDGQLGIGSTDDSGVPVRVGAGTNWKAVSAGFAHTVALKTDGSLWAWGNNEEGQLGVGSADKYSVVPVQVGADTNWSAVSAGLVHTVALKTDGSLWAWGNNMYGQLGDGSADGYSDIPVQIGTGWKAISAGLVHTVALKTDGSLWAWGDNNLGQLGVGSWDDADTPVQVGAAKDWSAVSAGAFHTVALKTDGGLWAWGGNDDGQLGNGLWTEINAPAQIGANKDWSAVSAGYYHTLALKTDGALWAWGWNAFGQLGNGSDVTGNAPVKIMSENYEDYTWDIAVSLTGKLSAARNIDPEAERAFVRENRYSARANFKSAVGAIR